MVSAKPWPYFWAELMRDNVVLPKRLARLILSTMTRIRSMPLLVMGVLPLLGRLHTPCIAAIRQSSSMASPREHQVLEFST
jgi:hypothetical protein